MYLDAAVDKELVLDDGVVGAGAGYLVTGLSQVGGSDAAIDVGRDVGAATQNAKRFPDISFNINVTSIDTADANETYLATLEWADDNTFGTLVDSSPAVNIVAGRNFFTTKVLGRWVRLRYTLTGTTPILKVERAYLSSYSQ
ncbi:hypothetical protein LCGC14_0773700 [marine sediment metagenome]|uniref:Uncharacterized protein n=1 Tax=marine sediment metagenome TaxID=412755 RepID=A0A0F9T4G6_9ZZZZ